MFKRLQGGKKIKLIDPNKVYNYWLFAKPRKYELINTIDIDVEITPEIKTLIDAYNIFKKKKENIYSCNSFFVKGLNNVILQRIKKEKILEDYDALVIIHITNFKDRLMVSLDCFKEVKCV